MYFQVSHICLSLINNYVLVFTLTRDVRLRSRNAFAKNGVRKPFRPSPSLVAGFVVEPTATDAGAYQTLQHSLLTGFADEVKRILVGLPHTSGANIARIEYFLGKRPREEMRGRNNPDIINANKERLMHSLQNIQGCSEQIER